MHETRRTARGIYILAMTVAASLGGNVQAQKQVFLYGATSDTLWPISYVDEHYWRIGVGPGGQTYTPITPQLVNGVRVGPKVGRNYVIAFDWTTSNPSFQSNQKWMGSSAKIRRVKDGTGQPVTEEWATLGVSTGKERLRGPNGQREANDLLVQFQPQVAGEYEIELKINVTTFTYEYLGEDDFFIYFQEVRWVGTRTKTLRISATDPPGEE